MAHNFLGRGWTYPPAIDFNTGGLSMSEYEQDILESIHIILSTAKGERLMRPDFGCGIHDLVFDVINTATIGRVESSVREALTLYESRIILLAVDVSSREAQEGRLLVSIDYRIRETNHEFNMVFPFYLTEGS